MERHLLIIGGGPAGVSCALYTCRAGIPTTIFAKDDGALSKAEKIENYYGLPSPLSGSELHRTGLAQAETLGAAIVREEVVGVSFDGAYTVHTTAKEYHGSVLLLATGKKRQSAPIPGLKEYEGRGVSYCATCDGFFYRGKDVCVLGNGPYALHEADYLAQLAKSVTLLTNGQPAPPETKNLIIHEEKIAQVDGENQKLRRIHFAGGGAIEADGLFVALGTASAADIAQKLGCLLSGDNIVVNPSLETNVPGCFAAGDCVGGLLQVSKAVSDGAMAAQSIIRLMRS